MKIKNVTINNEITCDQCKKKIKVFSDHHYIFAIDKDSGDEFPKYYNVCSGGCYTKLVKKLSNRYKNNLNFKIDGKSPEFILQMFN